MKKNFMNDADYFNEWFETFGIRTYSKNHGTADGHRDYMASAFLAGYHACEKNDSLLRELREENARLKSLISGK